MGAEIIKVEPPGQPDPMRDWGHARYQEHSLWWPVLSRNKKCVTLNLRKERGQELLLELARRSDVVVENFRPGTLERWNLGYERMRSVNDGLILARVSGYGQTGPYAARAGFASAAEAMGGLRYINGFPDSPPPRMGISLGDSLAGMFAAQGVLAALYKRDALGYGHGQVVDALDPRGLLRPARGRGPRVRPAGHRAGAQRHLAQGRRAVEHLQVARRQVDGHRRQPEPGVRPVVRGDGPARAGRGRALRDSPGAGREPGGARRADRATGRPSTTPSRHRPRAQRGPRGVRPDLHDRGHLRRPALQGAGHAARPPGPRVRRVHRTGDRAQAVGHPGRGALVGHLGGRLAQRGDLRRAARACRPPSAHELREEGVL